MESTVQVDEAALERRLLIAVALEGTLPVDALALLLARWSERAARVVAAEHGAVAERWVQRGLAQGWLASVTGARPVRFSAGAASEGVRVPRTQRQTVLRGAPRQELHEVGETCRTVLRERSRAALSEALQAGRVPLQSLGGQSAAELAREVRAAICEPFDGDWLSRTFGDAAHLVALEVLEQALPDCGACTELFTWAASSDWSSRPDLELRAARALTQHAALREHLPLARRWAEALPLAERWGALAALSAVEGDLATAERLLTQALTLDARALGAFSQLAPLVALLLERQGTEAAREAAARLMTGRRSAVPREVTTAWRTLQRYARDPDARHQRVEVHRVAREGSAWALLLLGVTVHAYAEQALNRTVWGAQLLELGRRWIAQDYTWLGRQALLLAQALSPAQVDEALEGDREARAWLRVERQGAIGAWVRRQADWERALLRLSRLGDAPQPAPAHTQRVEWFVNLTHAALSAPSVASWDGSWGAGRRATVGELLALRAELPPEDQRVLDCCAWDEAGNAALTLEAFEALIGHPRVVEGRGHLPVVVERGEPHLRVEERASSLHLHVHPPGLALGVNVVVEEPARLVVYRVSEGVQRVIDALPRGLDVPRDQEAQALGVLERLAPLITVRGDHTQKVRVVAADAAPCLRLAQHAGAWLLELGVRPFGPGGRFFPPAHGPGVVTRTVPGGAERAERRFGLEQEQRAQLIAESATLQALSAQDDDEGWVLGAEGVLELLCELRAAVTPHALEWPEAAPRLRGTLPAGSVQGSLRRTKGWYLATGGLAIDEVTHLKLSELVHLPTLGRGRFLRLPTGDYVEVERRVRRVIAALAVAEPARGSSGALRFSEGTLPALRELLGEPGFEVDAATRAWFAERADVAVTDVPVPAGLTVELRSYQREGFQWLCALTDHGLGACLADDMGLGKTVQILALLERARGEGPALVVAPTSVCTNWVLEARRFAPQLEVVEHEGSDRGARLEQLTGPGATPGRSPVIVCSYTLLQQDVAALSEVAWATVVLDEAQFIKNPASRRARAAHRLRARRRVAATGTPVENHLGDLWSVFRFLNPALLGTWLTFQRRFMLPIERDGDDERRLALRRIVTPFILRRLKEHVLRELPQRTTIDHHVEFSEHEALRYGLLRRQIHEKLRTPQGKRHRQLDVLAEITRLRRFCCHPRLVFPDAGSWGSKLEAALRLIEELVDGGHRALVFSQFVDFLALLRERLDEQQIRYEYLDGATPKRDRQARVDAFQGGASAVFLISLRAGGMGLNLTGADYVLHLDPWWNPAVEAQATDRAHRLGQERPVTVYRLLMRESIEERVVELHRRKRELAEGLLVDGRRAEALSVDELWSLLEATASAD